MVDLAIILVLWPAARDPGHEVTLRGVFRQWVALPIAIATAAFAWIALSFPGEPHAEWTRYWPDKDSRSTAHRFGNGLQCRTRSPISAVYDNFDRLYLPRVDVVDDEALKKIEEHTKAAGEPDYQGERTQHLRGRDFNCADFSDYADLRRVDLTDASLRGASFNGSKLQGVTFEKAQLQGASLEKTQLQGASLDKAQLQGASLDRAQLQGASLDRAQLQGASLHFAQLQGASFWGAKLQGASLFGAQLQGASLNAAQLQGASLKWAKLQGASLIYAQLQGASLEFVQLQGASLNAAQLQGANLSDAALTEAVLSEAAVWHTRNGDCEGASIQGSKYDAIIQFDFWRPAKSIQATPDATAKFIDDATAGIPGTKIKQQAINRMRAGLIVDPAKDDTAQIAKVWHICEEESAKVSQAEFDKKHATFLRDLVCNAEESRQAIAKGIIRKWIAVAESLFLPNQEHRDAVRAQLARGLLGEDGKPCAATKDLDEADVKKLRAAIARAPKPTSPTAPASPSAAPPSAALAPNAAPATAVAPAPAPTTSASPE